MANSAKTATVDNQWQTMDALMQEVEAKIPNHAPPGFDAMKEPPGGITHLAYSILVLPHVLQKPDVAIGIVNGLQHTLNAIQANKTPNQRARFAWQLEWAQEGSNLCIDMHTYQK